MNIEEANKILKKNGFTGKLRNVESGSVEHQRHLKRIVRKNK